MKNKNFATIYIVRHGETEWNQKKLVQGQKDSPLTKGGIEQAKQLAKELKKANFDLIFSSDLLRAKKTAEIIAAEHELAVESTNLLRERKLGNLEGKSVEALRAFEKLFKELKEEEIFKYKSHPDIESDEEITTRLITFLRETAITHPGKKILAVTHGGTIRALLIKLGFSTYKDPVWVNNGGYIKLETDGIEFFVQDVKGIDKKRND